MKKLQIRKSRPSDKSSRSFKLKKPAYRLNIAFLIIASLALLAGSGVYWYQNVFTDPDRVFEAMLDKSLQTSSVTRTVDQEGGRNKVHQTVNVSFSPQTVAKSTTNLEELSETGTAAVTTETLGTKDADYVRYTSINVEGNNQPGNYDRALNVWGKKEADPERGQQTSFLNEALFVLVPFGNLNEEQRAAIKSEIKQSKLYEVRQTTREMIDGRPVITYEMSVSPQSLVQVLAKYVELTGVGSSAELNPASYEGTANVAVKMRVDMLSHHLDNIEFVGTGRVESYKAYNTSVESSLPSQTISIDELQERLSSVAPREQ